MALKDKIAEMKALKERIDKGEELLKQLREQYDKLRLFTVPEAMMEQDMTSIRGEFGRCTLQGDLTVKVFDKEKLHEWLEGSGFGALIVPTVNAQTLKSFVKEQQGAGTMLPEDILQVNPFTRAVLYKS